MALTGETALKDYIDDLFKKEGITIFLEKDIRNDGFKLAVIKGQFMEFEIVQPWVANSANWEWLLITRIKTLKEKLDERIKNE